MAFLIVIVRCFEKTICGCNHNVIAVCLHHEIFVAKRLHDRNPFIKIYKLILYLALIGKERWLIVIRIDIDVRQMIPKMVSLCHAQDFFLHRNIICTEKYIVPS